MKLELCQFSTPIIAARDQKSAKPIPKVIKTGFSQILRWYFVMLQIVGKLYMSEEKKRPEISYKSQKLGTVILSLGFFVMSTAFAPIQAVITKLYTTFGH